MKCQSQIDINSSFYTYLTVMTTWSMTKKYAHCVLKDSKENTIPTTWIFGKVLHSWFKISPPQSHTTKLTNSLLEIWNRIFFFLSCFEMEFKQRHLYEKIAFFYKMTTGVVFIRGGSSSIDIYIAHRWSSLYFCMIGLNSKLQWRVYRGTVQ